MKRLLKQRELVILALVALAAMLIPFLAAPLADVFSYNRRDGFMFFTPGIFTSHRQLLQGHLPVWNHLNNMGEPLIDNGQLGVFYPIYTFAVALVAGLRLPLDSLLLIVGVLHNGIAAAGIFAFLRFNGVRTALAALAAVTGVAGGYYASITPIWMANGGNFAWIPWILLGLQQLARGQLPGLPKFLIAFIACAAIAHPQQFAYVCALSALAALGYWVIEA
jgi:hypothetical protein